MNSHFGDAETQDRATLQPFCWLCTGALPDCPASTATLTRRARRRHGRQLDAERGKVGGVPEFI